MKLWKILVATMIALLLVCAVAMAEEDEPNVCPNGCTLDSVNTVLTEPTCTKLGEKGQRLCTVKTCDNYKVFVNKQPIAALGHDYTEATADRVESTCTATGEKHLYCRRFCGETGAEKVETIKMKDHDYKLYAELSTAPTCTAAGEDVFQCRVCEKIETKPVKATGHSFTVYVEAKPATCAAAGYTEHRKCAYCDATELKNVVPVLSTHTAPYKVTENCVAPTCAANGVDYYRCATCGDEYTKVVNATGNHTWERKDGKEATCVDDGYTWYKQCSVCKAETGKVVIPATGTAHTWTAYGGKKEATCTEGGWEKTEICKDCGTVNYINKTEKLGHDFSILKNSGLPTCHTEGYEIYGCSRCTATDTVKVAKLPHNFADSQWKTRLAASCTSGGVEYRECTMPGCTAEETRTTEAKGHVMGNPTWIKAPTCTEDGEGIKKCFNCSKEETVVIDALGHDKWEQVVVEADCIHVGMKHIWCDREQKILEKNVIIPAKGHKGEVTKYVAPTCTSEGTKTTKCENCNQTVTETLAKLDHVYTWVEVTKPSPAGNGKSEYKCACGDIADTKTVKYTKWYYNNTMTSFGPTTKELVGGNDWYRVTPVDLAVDGVYTYDLIASNKYVVGTVTISVNAGTLSVSYKAQHGVEVKDEALLIYASKADLAAGSAVTAAVGSAINTAETFGEDTKVLVSLILTGNYDAAGKNYVDADAASALAANID